MKFTDQDIVDYIAVHARARRRDIRDNVAPGSSDATIWRVLKRLVDEEKLEVSGKGPATVYSLSGPFAVRVHLGIPHNRRKPVGYRKEFLDSYIPNKTFYLGEDDRRLLRNAGKLDFSPEAARIHTHRVIQRFLIDLSWASSRMEGNTYSLPETEMLIRFDREASGKEKKETVMILNHKEAIQYVVDNISEITVGGTDIYNIHALLSNNLLVDPAMSGRLRRMPVGISGSRYMPLEDQSEIREEFDILIHKAAGINDPFEQAFFLLVHIPYLQAFEDANRRTSRVVSNIPLLKADLLPMSFVFVDEGAYADGLVGVYELNNSELLRKVYIDAYMVSAENYRVFRGEIEVPEKAALAYRDFVCEAVRRSVIEWKAFRYENILSMAEEADIPEEDRREVVDYVRREFQGLHEGNVIRYKLRPEDLEEISGD